MIFVCSYFYTGWKKQQLLKQQSRPSITYSDFSMHGECRFFTWFNSFSGELDLTWCCLFIGPIHSYHMDLFVTLMQVKVTSATSKSQVVSGVSTLSSCIDMFEFPPQKVKEKEGESLALL